MECHKSVRVFGSNQSKTNQNPSIYDLPLACCAYAKVKAMSQRDSAFTHVTACTLAKSPSDSLHQRLQQFRCSPCRSDCYRVERTSSRAGILPLWTATRAAAKNGILVDFRSVCADLTEPDNSHL
jgi:hypothetical protein